MTVSAELLRSSAEIKLFVGQSWVYDGQDVCITRLQPVPRTRYGWDDCVHEEEEVLITFQLLSGEEITLASGSLFFGHWRHTLSTRKTWLDLGESHTTQYQSNHLVQPEPLKLLAGAVLPGAQEDSKDGPMAGDLRALRAYLPCN